MSRLIPSLAAFVLLAVAGFFGWQWLFPSEEARVRQRLEDLAADASRASDDLASLASAARVSGYFTEDVVIDPGGGVAPLRGREVILAAASTLRPRGGTTVVSLKDADVTLAPGGTSAAVTLTALVTRNAGTERETLDAHEFALAMVKRESDWLIAHVTSIDTLR